MKNFKRFAALSMASLMVVGSGITAMANEGGASGSGDYEGYVEETSVFSVVVPTDASATAGFDFFVDPNNLLSQTGYASKGGQASEFDTNSTLFFTRTVSDTVTTKYGKDSDSITFTNKSSYDVDVEVSATVTGTDGITLGAVSDDTTDPTISLSLVSGSDTEAITADGAKLTGTIAGTNDNFEIKWNSTDSKYEYGLKDNVDDDTWQTYSFNLTGACGGTWTAAQAEIQPTVNLTWKVTDPKTILTLANNVLTAKINVADFKDGILKIGDVVGALDTRAGSWGGSDGAVTFTFNSTWANAIKGQTCEVTVNLKDGTKYEASFNVPN